MPPKNKSCRSPLPYVPIDPNIDDHERTQALIDALAPHTSIPEAFLVEIPQKIIKHCGRGNVDGVLGNLSAKAIARLCCWPGDPDVLRDALIATGWLDRDPETGELAVHNWAQYGGQVFAKRLRWVERKARWRAERVGQEERGADEKNVPVTSPGRPRDVPVTSPGSHAMKCEVCSVKCEDVKCEDVKCEDVKCEKGIMKFNAAEKRGEPALSSSAPDVNLGLNDEISPRARVVKLGPDPAIKAAMDPHADAIKRLSAEWLAHFSPGTRRVGKRHCEHLRARLRSGWTEQQLSACLRYIATSEWHKANGQVRLELACRSDEQVDKCLAGISASGARRPPGKTEQARQEALQILERAHGHGKEDG
jgi:hypothetical protein